MILKVGHKSQRSSRGGFSSAPRLNQLMPLVIFLTIGQVRQMNVHSTCREEGEVEREGGGGGGWVKNKRERGREGNKKGREERGREGAERENKK